MSLRKSSNLAYKFGKQRGFRKGWYWALVDSIIWEYAKNIIWNIRKKQNKEYCDHCGKQLFKSTWILHHKYYNPKEIFNLKYIRVLCNECHKKTHNK